MSASSPVVVELDVFEDRLLRNKAIFKCGPLTSSLFSVLKNDSETALSYGFPFEHRNE